MASYSESKKKDNGINHRSMADFEVYGPKVHRDVLSNRYMHYQGKGTPILQLATGVAFGTGASGVEHIAALHGGNFLHYTPIGGAATVLGPTAHANGLDLMLDQTNLEGAAYVPGGLLGPWRLVVDRSTTPPADPLGIFIRARLRVNDVSGAGIIAVGVRKSEAAQALHDDYDELFGVALVGGDILRKSILNNAATVSQDTGLDWLDDETHELEVQCFTNGKCVIYVDGAQPAVVGAAYQFDNAEVVVPYIQTAQGVDLTNCWVQQLTVGRLEQIEREG